MKEQDLQIKFKKLSQKYSTPEKVQKLLRSYKYNKEENGETCLSAAQVLKQKKCHCLEASFFAAAILEHKGYPPLVLSMESKDNLDHVIFIFKKNGKWGAIGRSRDEGLNGRAPIFRSLRDLVWSYFDPYIDKTGRITGFQKADLDHSKSDWRFSSKSVWKAEKYLIDLKHKKLKSSHKRYKKWYRRYLKNVQHPKLPFWW